MIDAALERLQAMPKKRGEAKLKAESYMQPVVEHLAKIFVFDDPKYKDGWEKSIERAFANILRYTNNVEKTGRLPDTLLQTSFVEEFDGIFEYTGVVTFHDKNRRMKSLTQNNKKVNALGSSLSSAITQAIPELIAVINTTAINPSQLDRFASAKVMTKLVVKIARNERQKAIQELKKAK